MATDVSVSFKRHFENEVHLSYQRMGSKLRNTVRSRNGVEGDICVFQSVGRGAASTKARHGKVPVMNTTHRAVECRLYDYYAGDWVDQLDELKLSFDERSVIAEVKAERNELHVVALSSQDEPEYRDAARVRAADAFFWKGQNGFVQALIRHLQQEACGDRCASGASVCLSLGRGCRRPDRLN